MQKKKTMNTCNVINFEDVGVCGEDLTSSPTEFPEMLFVFALDLGQK